MPRWLAKMLRDWHHRKARRLAAVAQKKREKLIQIDEQMERHEHRAKHWDSYQTADSRCGDPALSCGRQIGSAKLIFAFGLDHPDESRHAAVAEEERAYRVQP